VRAALGEIDQLDVVCLPTRLIRIAGDAAAAGSEQAGKLT
jgi:hypothetical protein